MVKKNLRRYSLRRISAMICGNQQAAALLKREGRFAGAVEVLPQYGVDVAEHQPARESGLRAELGLEGVPVIGYAGRMVAEKGLRQLFEALLKLQGYAWKLLLVGAGPLENEILQRWMPQLSGRVVYVPAVPYEQVARHLRCADIFVLASYSTASWAEQFGLTLAQAMMLGIPCVGSNCGAIPEVIGPGGVCFAEGQTDSLARALESLLSSPERRERFGAGGRRFALEHYSAEGIAGKYLAIFERARKIVASRARLGGAEEFGSASGSRRGTL